MNVCSVFHVLVEKLTIKIGPLSINNGGLVWSTNQIFGSHLVFLTAVQSTNLLKIITEGLQKKQKMKTLIRVLNFNFLLLKMYHTKIQRVLTTDSKIGWTVQFDLIKKIQALTSLYTNGLKHSSSSVTVVSRDAF